ncbi:DUF5664 domain-containing protein [Burkholderia sp. AU45274]|uniref:dATP/dGTP diphosphohydrolase domain-containing protein n=1 Tax=Burkholderia sp. AU45274 TaxID=3059205 RepID=UPI00265067BC|nr:dATP/dGTP diphosphohydrolase domain-containing protein [Burkholderia sp. AU45274]MDN7490563.1 DUF5664 domain-containing protein [Burkholderia sp. AU45274]
MSIGDVNSNERGSGARYNDGKPPLDLIPLRVIADHCISHGHSDEKSIALETALQNLASFQESGNDAYLHQAIGWVGAAWDECADVMGYGTKKYVAWNWIKGMPWSVPLGCAARHLLFGMMAGEKIDPESGKTHRGHFICNLMMLITFCKTYPEGNDLPIEWLKPRWKTEHASREDDARLIAKSNAEAF